MMGLHLFAKGSTIWMKNKIKRQDFNRVFSEIICHYDSYLHDNNEYSEKSVLNFLQEIHKNIAKHLNSFNNNQSELKALIHNKI